MKIAYFHGLESKVGGPKPNWLQAEGHEVWAPPMPYKSQPLLFEMTQKAVLEQEIELLVGSSMGGYFAYHLARLLDIPALLFNPALGVRSVKVKADQSGEETPLLLLAFGQNDQLIAPTSSQAFLAANWSKKEQLHYLWGEHGHRTPLPFFQQGVKEILRLL